MRIRQSNRPTYLSRRDQFRLLTLVGMIGLIVIAIDVARKPQSWYWLTGDPTKQNRKTENTTDTTKPKIDFRVNTDEGEELPANVVRVVEPDVPVGSEPIEPGGVQLTPLEIKQIDDNSVGIRARERDLYYDLLARARDLPDGELKKAARDDVAFAVLMTESRRFLGQVVTVRGEIRRLVPYPAGRNEHRIEGLYEAWLFNYDSGDNPYRVLCTSIPEGIPSGKELPAGTVVSVTGFYFKRYGYPAVGNRLHVAPLILARTLTWFEPQAATKNTDAELVPWILGFAGCFAVVVGITLWRFRLSDRRFEEQHLKRITTASSEAIEAINDLPTINVGESLRRLSESELSEPAPSPDDVSEDA